MNCTLCASHQEEMATGLDKKFCVISTADNSGTANNKQQQFFLITNCFFPTVVLVQRLFSGHKFLNSQKPSSNIYLKFIHRLFILIYSFAKIISKFYQLFAFPGAQSLEQMIENNKHPSSLSGLNRPIIFSIPNQGLQSPVHPCNVYPCSGSVLFQIDLS